MDPRVKDSNLDRDSCDLLKVHSEIIKNKKMIKHVFQEFYSLCVELDKSYLTGFGKTIEIGSGVSFIKETYPNIVTSDVKNYEGVDMVVDAQNMPFIDNEIHAFYGINCFHHFPKPNKFFAEIVRTLKPGGGVVLIEPYYGYLSDKIHTKIHKDEFFDKQQLAWETGQCSNQYMTGANQALSYIIFNRDKKIFEERFPELEIVYCSVLNNYIRYLVSGGVNFKQLMPDFLEGLLKVFEKLLKPFNKVFGLHHLIVIRKKDASQI